MKRLKNTQIAQAVLLIQGGLLESVSALFYHRLFIQYNIFLTDNSIQRTGLLYQIKSKFTYPLSKNSSVYLVRFLRDRRVGLTADQAVRGRALAVDVVLCSWARHLTLTEPLSTQVYEWVPANLLLRGTPPMDLHSVQRGVKIFLVASYYRDQRKTAL